MSNTQAAGYHGAANGKYVAVGETSSTPVSIPYITAVSLAPPLSQNLPLRTVEHDVDTHYGGKVVEQFLHFAVKNQIKRKIVVRGRHLHSPFLTKKKLHICRKVHLFAC